MEERYFKFSKYLKERFGERVHKVSVDAGFSCPNLDGTISKEGCIYCNNAGFSYQTRIASKKSLEEQIQEGISFGKKRFKARKFILYFQAFTNTYAPLNVLKERYDVIKKFNDIVGIAIGTRPDCIDEDILKLIETYTSSYEVWLEYGLQSIHENTLAYINRGHTYQDFLKAIKLTRIRRKIKICAHLIIGLPGENKDMILETAREVGSLKLDSVKLHPLHVIKDTKLDKMLKEGTYKPLKLSEYVETISEFLEYLWPKTVIQRLTADCPKELLVAPDWILDKRKVIEGIENNLEASNRFQGKLFKELR
jgi:hypothetical protein